MELETIWNGASWRDVPAPPPPPPREPQAYVRRDRPSQVGAKEHYIVGRTRVRAYLTDGAWRSVRDVVEAVGLSQRQVQIFLQHGVTKGTFERQERPQLGKRGRRGYVYRLQQTDTLQETQGHDTTTDTVSKGRHRRLGPRPVIGAPVVPESVRDARPG